MRRFFCCTMLFTRSDEDVRPCEQHDLTSSSDHVALSDAPSDNAKTQNKKLLLYILLFRFVVSLHSNISR